MTPAMRHDDNLTADRATFVSHLVCSMTGERYEADRLHGLSRVGRPLLVRYDLEAAGRALTPEVLAGRAAARRGAGGGGCARGWRGGRPADLWRYRELLPVRETRNVVSLGENATPIVPLKAVGRAAGAANLWVKDEGRLPTGSFKARGLVMAIAMAKELGVATIAMPTNGNAGAAAAAYATRVGIESVIFCPAATPEINVRETAAQ